MEGADDGTEAKVKVKTALLTKAIKALVQLVMKRTSNANPLFGSNSETMTVVFTLSKIPEKRRRKPVMIPLPHPMYDDKSEVCFISKDPQKKYKELLLKEHKVQGVTKVIGLDKIRRNYKTFEAKRALADAFDLFICDRDVVELMPRVLGSIFYKKKLKAPIAVKLVPSEPGRLLKHVLAGTPLRVPLGPSVGVKCGRCGMAEPELVANAKAVIGAALRHLGPVSAIALQCTGAPALPVWRRPRPPGEPASLRAFHSDGSSAASDTGVSGASEAESATEPSEHTGADSDLASEPTEPESSEDQEELPLLRGRRKAAGAMGPPKKKARGGR